VPGRGFTLLESIIVLAVLGIAAAGIASIQGNIFSGRSDNG
jgi:prepilin-type N-terminal cleavage/methylation domain-containing protein